MKKEKKSRKDKKENKVKKEKKSKDKDSKRRKHSVKDKRRSRDTSSSSSSSDDERLTPAQQLKQERAAVAGLRELLWYHRDARKDLRELLWTVDQGKAANIGGVPDAELRERLRNVLQLLQLRRAGSKDVLALPKDAPPTLSIVGFVFDEAPQPPLTRPAPKAAAAAPTELSVPAAESDQGRAGSGDAGEKSEGEARAAGAAGAGMGKGGSSISPEGPSPSSSSGGSSDEDEEGGNGSVLPPSVPTVPATAGGRRVVGPAMPSAEMLAAAAAAAAEASQGDGDEDEARQGASGGGDDDSLGDIMVGPPPPDMVSEMDALPEDAREAEVVRIMRVIRDARNAQEAARTGRGGAGAMAAAPGEVPPPPDAYSVLGVAHNTPTGDIKKRYMRLSLLIHPDKCTHADAHTAFQAVSMAAKTLQDTAARSSLDAAREERELRAMAERAAAAEEQARQWRVARGEEAAGPAVTAAPARATRDAWMTELPAEQSRDLMGDIMSQVSQRSFSRFGVKARGDTSEWTDTPAERAAKAANGGVLPGACGPLLIKGSAEAGGAPGAGTVDAALLDAFNSQSRKKTLLEQHLEAKDQPKAKKSKTDKGEKDRSKDKGKDKLKDKVGPMGPPTSGEGGAKGGDKSWVGKHPWRPFDRDTDLELKPKVLDPKKILAQQQGVLGSKFQSAGGTRHFL